MLNAINTGLWALGVWFAAAILTGALWIVVGTTFRAPQSLRDEVDHNF